MVCAVYNYEDHTTEFQLIENREERDKAIGSKYMQSKPGKIYEIAEDWLKTYSEKKLLFAAKQMASENLQKSKDSVKESMERIHI